jgi:hypothetical protein
VRRTFGYAATTKDAAQRSIRTFYEVVNYACPCFAMIGYRISSMLFAVRIAPLIIISQSGACMLRV